LHQRSNSMMETSNTIMKCLIAQGGPTPCFVATTLEHQHLALWRKVESSVNAIQKASDTIVPRWDVWLSHLASRGERICFDTYKRRTEKNVHLFAAESISRQNYSARTCRIRAVERLSRGRHILWHIGRKRRQIRNS